MTLRIKGKQSIHYAFLGAMISCIVLEIEGIGEYLFPGCSACWIIADISGSGMAPPIFLLAGYFFSNTDKQFKKSQLLLFIIPVVSVVLACTNSMHQLIYVRYSLYLDEIVYGRFIPVFSLYSYACLAIGFIYFISFTARNAGLFSRQALLIIFAFILPITVNFLAVLNVFKANALIITDTLNLTMLLLWFAIIKYDFLNIVPIALRQVINNISDGFILMDKNLLILDYNNIVQDIYNGAVNPDRRQSFLLLSKSIGFDCNAFNENICKSINEKKTVLFEASIEKELKIRHLVIELTPLFSKSILKGIIALYKDITVQKEYIEALEYKTSKLDEMNNELQIQNEEIVLLNKKLKELAETDGLTGVYNRRFFNQYYEIEILRVLNSTEYNLKKPDKFVFGIAIIDIDNFKRINDTYGHLAGDSILKQLVKVISSVVFTRDIICRYGGEEFAIIFTSTSKHDSYLASEKLRRMVESHEFHFNDEVKGHITVSIGLASFDEDYGTVGTDILKIADDRLYAAKKSGKNKVVYE